MSSNPKPKLHDDILIDTVEKMFFQKPKRGGNDKIDFRKRNPYTFFMAHKPITKTAFFTQFAKLRRVEFYNVIKGEETIEFHKDEEDSAVANQNELFTGPWRMSNILLEEIIRRKKFRVTSIVTEEYLQEREACQLETNASSLEAFCALFLGKKLDIADSINLAINKLQITEHPEDIKNNFEPIHAINSIELLINTTGEDNEEDFFSVCSSLSRSQTTADKTIKITIMTYVEVHKFVISNLASYTNLIIETCPKLTTLHFDINTFLYYGENTKDYFDKLNTHLSSFMNDFLKHLDKGHSELKICLTWSANCKPNEDIPWDHELFTIGTKFANENDTEDLYYKQAHKARILKVVDAIGREHECILKMLGISDPNQDSSEEDSSDSSDDSTSDLDDETDGDKDHEEDMEIN